MILEEIKRAVNEAPPWADGGEVYVVFESSHCHTTGDKVVLTVDDVRFDAEKGTIVITGNDD